MSAHTPSNDWYENDALWETLAPVLFNGQRWAAAPAEVDQILALAPVSPGAAILDLGCGPGRHALELARRGYRVTGVDRTTAYLTEARRRADAEGLDVELVRSDMRTFLRPESFDLALSLWTVFGYFADQAENQRVLDHICASLKAGGRLVMELMGKEVLARIFLARTWEEVDDILLLEERHVTQDWSWLENRWIVIRGTERSTWTLSHWLYSAAELVTMMKAGGFRSVAAYGDLGGAPYDTRARRLVLVAQK